MSGSALLGIGTTALFANYAAIQTTGNNISNANTPGYSRQQVELESAGGQYTGSGFFGKGVQITTVARAHDDFLTKQAALTQSQSSADASRLEQLQQLENVFPTGEAGLGYASGQFLNAFVDIANNPQDLSARSVALGDAQDLALRFRSAGDQINALQANVAADIGVGVGTVNSLAKSIADLNTQIAQLQGSGHTPNDLLDQRDQLVNQLSSYIQVTTIPASDGSTSVFIGGGQTLVLGGNATALAAVPDTFDPTRVQIGLQGPTGTQALPSSLITGGSLAGLLRFQNSDLVAARNQLGQMAQALAGKVNLQQSLGLDLTPPAGQAGAPIFNTGAISALPASTNTGSSSVSLSIVDATQLKASDYLLKPDPATAGNYLVTRLSDNTTVSVASGATVDGFQITVGAPAPAAGDQFLLKPVGSAAFNMQCVLDDPKGIAAASPVTATMNAANTGTASVASLQQVSAPTAPNLTATISFTNGTGAYNWLLRDSLGNTVGSGTGNWTAGQPIALDGWQLSLSGVPANGDVVTVQPTAYPATNNGNARAFTGLRDTAIVGLTGTSGGATITDAYANAMTDVGVRVNGAKASADMSASLAQSAKEAVANKAGVNLDEEAAKLMQYQQSYQAAAKILQVAQTVFDSLLSAAGAN